MAYERQYYTNGDVLDARQMNHMETGIKENSDNIDKHSEDIATKASAIKEKASGELIIVNDSAEAKPLGLAIDGKSEQTRYSGKNLLNDSIRYLNVNEIYFGSKNNTDFPIYLQSGTYTFSVVHADSSFVTNMYVKRQGENTAFAQIYAKNALTFTLDEASYVTAWVYNESYASANDVLTAQIESGSTATDYEPYCGGIPSPNPSYPQEIRNIGVYDEASGKYAVEVKGTGKNIFDMSKGVNNTSFHEGNGNVNEGGNSIYVLKIPILSGEALTISNVEGTDYLRISSLKADGTWIKREALLQANGKSTFTVSDEVRFLEIAWNNGITKAMIEYGTVASDYEPYKETTVTVYLDEPLRKGDKAYWNGGSKVRVERNRFAYTVNGTTLIASNQSDLENVRRFSVILTRNGVPKGKGHANNMALCDSLIRTVNYSLDKEHFYVDGDSVNLFIPLEELNGHSDTSSYLSENPILVEYEMETPITEEIDIDLGELSMFYPTTILSNDCNANMEVTYIADTKAYIDKKFAELATAMV